MTWLSTWSVIKAAGMTSYFLLFLSVVFGVFSYGKLLSANLRGVFMPLHQLTGWLGFLFGLLHGMVLTIDSYQPFSLKAVFVPFTAGYQPWASGFGTLSLYFFFLLLVTSDWMKKFGRKLWRSVHYLAFPAYLLSLIHGLMVGSDTKHAWAQAFYVITAAAFVAVIVLRIRVSANKKSGPGGQKREPKNQAQRITKASS